MEVLTFVNTIFSISFSKFMKMFSKKEHSLSFLFLCCFAGSHQQEQCAHEAAETHDDFLEKRVRQLPYQNACSDHDCREDTFLHFENLR